MKFSRGTNYALHTMLYPASTSSTNKPIGIQQLAEKMEEQLRKTTIADLLKNKTMT